MAAGECGEQDEATLKLRVAGGDHTAYANLLALYEPGLLSNAERKSSWQLAELAGEAAPDWIQRRRQLAQVRL